MRFDFTIVYPGGQRIERQFLDEQSAPKKGDIREIEVEGKPRKIRVTKIWGPFTDSNGIAFQIVDVILYTESE